MKAKNLVIAFASLVLLASCGNNNPVSSASEPEASSSAQKQFMDFLQDGQFYACIGSDVSALVDGKRPIIKVNGIDIQGSLASALDGKFTLEAEGQFSKDLYISVAALHKDGGKDFMVYGGIEKENLNEAFPSIAAAIGVPSKLFIDFSTTPESWEKGHDEEMDKGIQEMWDLTKNG